MFKQIEEHIILAKNIDIEMIKEIASLAAIAIKNGNKILIFGNGGSAADAQHFAAELVGRFQSERKAYPAIALTTDTSAITAIANDYGYEYVFSRQVDALAAKEDVVIGISTSGNSLNVMHGLRAAKDKECFTVLMTGDKKNTISSEFADYVMNVDSSNTARIQEMHILILHLIAEEVENINAPYEF